MHWARGRPSGLNAVPLARDLWYTLVRHAIDDSFFGRRHRSVRGISPAQQAARPSVGRARGLKDVPLGLLRVSNTTDHHATTQLASRLCSVCPAGVSQLSLTDTAFPTLLTRKEHGQIMTHKSAVANAHRVGQGEAFDEHSDRYYRGPNLEAHACMPAYVTVTTGQGTAARPASAGQFELAAPPLPPSLRSVGPRIPIWRWLCLSRGDRRVGPQDCFPPQRPTR
jgi:hypothetical protein